MSSLSSSSQPTDANASAKRDRLDNLFEAMLAEFAGNPDELLDSYICFLERKGVFATPPVGTGRAIEKVNKVYAQICQDKNGDMIEMEEDGGFDLSNSATNVRPIEWTTANGNATSTVLELVLPFVPLDELFPNVCLVSKDIHQHCTKLLYEHCEKRHPTLIFMANNQCKETGCKKAGIQGKNENPWLTYNRYRFFLYCCDTDTNNRNGIHVIPQHHCKMDYELIMEISSVEKDKDPVVLLRDIQQLKNADYELFNPNGDCCMVTKFELGESNCPNYDKREGELKELGLQVRVFMRDISNGKLAVVWNLPTTRAQAYCSYGNDYCEYYIGDDHNNSGNKLWADLPIWGFARFFRYRKPNGEIEFTIDTDGVWDKKVLFGFQTCDEDQAFTEIHLMDIIGSLAWF